MTSSKRDRLIELHPELAQEFEAHDPAFRAAFTAAARVISRGGTVAEAARAALAAKLAVLKKERVH